MKTSLCSAVGAVVLLVPALSVFAEVPIITSFSQNGLLVCSNLEIGSVATVEWASSLQGPWHASWDSLTAVPADMNGNIQVSVPMFYRVRGDVGSTNSTWTNSFSGDGMALIPAGVFMIGNSIGDGDAWVSDAPPTVVYVSSYYLDTNLVTYQQWQLVYHQATNLGFNFIHSGAGKGMDHPVQSVDWFDCIKWCNARSQLAGLTPVYYTDAGFTQLYTGGESNLVYANWSANGYRLPTEAEWEKAARGGLSAQRFPWGNSISWSQANYYGRPADFAYDLAPGTGFAPAFNDGIFPYTSPVGSFAPNGYGLNDMAGNVYAWCWDVYADSPFPAGSPYLGGINPRGASGAGNRVLRGGEWNSDAAQARCAYRNYGYPANAYLSIGFRCARAF